MLKNTKIIFSFFCIKSIYLLLPIFIAQANAETKIIAKSGDTLLKLSKEHGIPLKELMHKNNFTNANKIVEGETIIIPLKNREKNNVKTNNFITYKVMAGDNLYKIARNYNVNVKDIIAINNLDNDTLIKPNQIILLPDGAVYKKVVDQKYIKQASKKVFYHQTSETQELKEIARIHNVIKEDIIKLNQLTDPLKINSNVKLKIRQNKSIKWLKYHTLTVNWSDWRYLDGHYITTAKSSKNRLFYLAINCEKRTLNNTLKTSNWINWYFPQEDFEFKLISDFCDQDFKI